MANYWLIKSEPDCYSIDDLKNDKKTLWTGIRNYQARNFMRDSMKVGDLALFYHSGTSKISPRPEVVGIAKVVTEAKPDTSAMDKNDDHYDPKSTKENPIWVGVEFSYVEKFDKPVSLDQIKFEPQLKGIMVAQRGSRLSIQPITKPHFDIIVNL